MAFLTSISTSTLNNQDISAALLVHTYTNTVRIKKLYVNVDLDQVAGSGDYIAYLTVQRAGAGSFYETIRTTKTAGAAVTSVTFGTIPVILGTTDVMRVYVIGLAGDTVTPDIITTIYEEYIATDANGVVSANLLQIMSVVLVGTAADIAAAFGTFFNVNLSTLTTTNIVNFIAQFTGITSLANWLRGLARSDAMDAVAKAELNAGGGTYNEATDSLEAHLEAIADQVWDEALAGHALPGSAGVALSAAGGAADPWLTLLPGAYGPGTAGDIIGNTIALLVPGAKEWPYLVTNTGTGLAEPDVDVWFTTINLSTAQPVWRGVSDAFGYAKDVYGENPWLDLGTYYVWKHKVGFTDPQFPDIEVVV